MGGYSQAVGSVEHISAFEVLEQLLEKFFGRYLFSTNNLKYFGSVQHFELEKTSFSTFSNLGFLPGYVFGVVTK